jgi:membrane protease subunit (stomatin/prohibitin family)
MGLFKKFVKSQFIEVIEWQNEDQNKMVYRFPVMGNEIKMGAQLTVRPSQVAIFVNEGQVADIFEAGRHTLSTANMPILTKLKSWKYGFNSPFKADVYFVSTKQFTNMKWGTKNPVMMRDQEFGRVRVRALGLYAFKVNNPRVFLEEIFGSTGDFRTDAIQDYLRGIVVGSLSDLFAESQIPVMDFTSNLDELAQEGQAKLANDFSKIGFEITQFVIENISLPEEVMQAMDERNKMSMLGVNNYTTYKAANAMEAAASNPGGGMASAGIGMGAGAAMGNMMAGAFNSDSTGQPCRKCGHVYSESANFCPECGSSREETVACIQCQAPLKKGAKFCSECGSKQVKACQNCGADLGGGKFCPECGTKVE